MPFGAGDLKPPVATIWWRIAYCVLMDLAERRRQANGDVEDASQIERLPLVLRKNPIERLTAQVLED